MEVWEVGAALGAATGDLEDWQEDRARLEAELERESDIPGAMPQRVKSGRDILAQRVAASRGEAPDPEAPVMHQLQMASIMRTLGGN
jgi:hypothetical protein